VLWESRARDDAGFFVHDALHEPPDRILFPGAAIQRSVDGHPDTVILDLCCYEALAAILPGTSNLPHQPAQFCL
jgi:hypothetical protein